MRKNRDQRNTAENTRSSSNTKRALIQSMVALFSCCLLLIGATYAWFTDTINTVNTIQAGNLDLNVTMKDETGDYNTTVTDDTKLFNADFNWEPGAVQVVQLKVENAGDLNLAYKIGAQMLKNQTGINVAGETLDLAEYIKFAIVDEELNLETLGRSEVVAKAESCGNSKLLSAFANTSEAEAAEVKAKTLKPGDANFVTLVAYMPETVGNEANYLKGEATNRPYVEFGVDFKATQLNSESDSFGSDYDKTAETELNNMDKPANNPEVNPTFYEEEVEDPLAYLEP